LLGNNIMSQEYLDGNGEAVNANVRTRDGKDNLNLMNS
jgi:hypothetical protein